MAHHAHALHALKKTALEVIHDLATDYTEADVSSEDMTMLGYAAKVTVDQTSVTGEDIEALRAHGFDDRAIHDISLIAAYFNFVNRIADGLALELESEGAKWASENGFEDRFADGFEDE